MLYTKLLKNFHSSGLKIGFRPCGRRLCCGCSQVRCASTGRLVLVGDGIKIPKRGKKMPAVKLLHQQSESNTKPEYIMGHSLQAVGLLVHAAQRSSSGEESHLSGHSQNRTCGSPRIRLLLSGLRSYTVLPQDKQLGVPSRNTS
jgi:hypothetical protein